MPWVRPKEHLYISSCSCGMSASPAQPWVPAVFAQGWDCPAGLKHEPQPKGLLLPPPSQTSPCSHLLPKPPPSSAPSACAPGLCPSGWSCRFIWRPGLCKLRLRRRDLLDPGAETVQLPRRNERQSLGTMAGFSALGLLFLCQLLATASAQVRSLIYVLHSRKKDVSEKDTATCICYTCRMKCGNRHVIRV